MRIIHVARRHKSHVRISSLIHFSTFSTESGESSNFQIRSKALRMSAQLALRAKDSRTCSVKSFRRIYEFSRSSISGRDISCSPAAKLSRARCEKRGIPRRRVLRLYAGRISIDTYERTLDDLINSVQQSYETIRIVFDNE